jgi:two-component system CheB/CheR fusion protein
MEAETESNLVTAVTALAGARSLEEVTKAVRDCARELTNADGVTFVLRDGEECFYAEEDAIAPLWKGRRFPIESCISGWSMLNRKPAVIRDIYRDARIPQDAYRPTFVKSLLMMPVGQDDPVAAIGAYWARVHEPTPQEQRMLQSVANAAAMAMRNVYLDSQLQAAVRRESEARKSAEELNTLKDQFLATLSHELRTPLHVIRNWAWQLKKLAGNNEHVKKAAEVIDRNATMQARLVEDLLDVSRAAAGKLKIELQLMDLGAMCAAVVEVVQPSAREKGITLTLEQDPSVQIWGDPDRVQQILWNIITNAIKFTPAGGGVTVRATRRLRHACVIVKDTGAGVDPQFLPHIFERFRQADGSATRRHGGLGLGLTIVKELMDLHRGSVRAESEGLGRGLTMTLEFPVPAVTDQPGAWLQRRAGHEDANGNLAGLTVLVVDDETDVLAALEGVLQQAGAVVLTARGAQEALEAVEQHRPSVILSDISMPEGDGLSLVRQLRSLGTSAATIPAAALSAYPAGDFASAARSAGFHDYLEKPVSPDELVSRVRSLGSERLQ